MAAVAAARSFLRSGSATSSLLSAAARAASRSGPAAPSRRLLSSPPRARLALRYDESALAFGILPSVSSIWMKILVLTLRYVEVAAGDEQRLLGVADAHAQRDGFGAHDVAPRRPGSRWFLLDLRR